MVKTNHSAAIVKCVDGILGDSLKDVDRADESEDSESESELLCELQDIVGFGLNKDGECPEGPNASEMQNKSETLLKTTEVNTIEILKQRIEMYTLAEANAKADGEHAKVRRFNRGLKTLNELLRHSISGKLINPDDIPPPVNAKPSISENSSTSNVNYSNKVPSPPATMASTIVEKPTEKNDSLAKNPIIQQMLSRQQEYKIAALTSKRNGDNAMALEYVRVFKRFDAVIKMCEDGQDVDLSDMPPPPEHFKEFIESMQQENKLSNTSAEITPNSTSVTAESGSESINFNSTDILEALQERLSKYKSVEEAAKIDGNTSKARRFGRIVKQYEIAINDYKAGRTVAYAELPVPPGFAPLPAETINVSNSLTEVKQKAVPSTPTLPSKKLSTSPEQDLAKQALANSQKTNLAENQIKILLDRQKEFKMYAIEAKKAGEMNQAKEYLKMYKGFDALLVAARSGLPVDLSSVSTFTSKKLISQLQTNNLFNVFYFLQ